MKNNRSLRISVVLLICLHCLPPAGRLFTAPLQARGAARGAPDGPDVLRLAAQSGFHGGLAVLVGLKDAAPALALAGAPNVLVHGLVSDRNALEGIRRQIRSSRAYQQAWVTEYRGPALPYGDDMVNLLVVTDRSVQADDAEIERVLAPGATAWTWRGGVLTSHRKPRPRDVDEWTHARYDASGNAVSRDKRIGPPRFLQWEALPRWNHGTKTSCLVSAGGRIFYILDDSRFGAAGRTWSLIARDAYNGVLLWRRPLAGWEGARGGKKVGPVTVDRRLAALGDRVYATLGESAPVSVLDARTGEVLRVLEETARVREFIVADGVLVALINPNTGAASRRGEPRKPQKIVAVDPGSGRELWRAEEDVVLPMTLASDGRQVVYHDGTVIRSLDLRTGKPRWESPPTGQKVVHWASGNPDRPGAVKGEIVLAPQFAPTLIIYDGVVGFAGGCQLNVVSADDGRELWRSAYSPSGYSVPVDLFGFGGRLWGPDVKMNQWRPVDDKITFDAWDVRSGRLMKRVSASYRYRFQHHRCYRMKAVDHTVLVSRAGIEFLDTDTGAITTLHWVRGSCYYGVMPANGLLYVPPHNCACYVRAKLFGFLALKANPPARSTPIPDAERLERGPAYGAVASPEAAHPEDWPTYRRDALRSGTADTRVAPELLLGWQTAAGRQITSPVVADGRVFVASLDAAELSALDADAGKVLWRRTFDAGIDSPPTVHQGLVICGCRDGSVVALRAADGASVWRFRACPEERLIVSRGRIESVWPVHGSVLLLNDTVYLAAGRSSYLDGGIHVYGLDVRTGRPRVHAVLNTRNADGGEVLDPEGVDGFLNDVLAGDGRRIFMRHQVLDLTGKPTGERIPHLHSPDGFLSWDSTTRLVWTYAPVYTSPHQGAFYDVRLSRVLFPSGRILVVDNEVVYGYGQNHYDTLRADPGGQWALFAADKNAHAPLGLTARQYLAMGRSGKAAVRFRWWKRVPIRVWAMVKTRDVLFAAGPPGYAAASPEAFAGKTKGVLLAFSPADGKVLARMTLPAPPVWDGMAAARGNFYISLTNGQVVCLWPAASGRGGTPLSAGGWRAVLPPVKVDREPGLLGRWRFDEGRGMLARDCSGNGRDADVTASWAAGDFGTCVVVSGTPQAVVIPDGPAFRFGNRSFSLALWVKVDRYDVRIMGKEAFPKNWWVINVLGDGRAELVLGEGRGPGLSVRARTRRALPTDAWSHLVAVVDREAGEVRMYLNGREESRTPIPKTMNKGLDVPGVDISIPSKFKPFYGLLGDFRIYDKAVPPERVRELFEEGARRYTSTRLRARD